MGGFRKGRNVSCLPAVLLLSDPICQHGDFRSAKLSHLLAEVWMMEGLEQFGCWMFLWLHIPRCFIRAGGSQQEMEHPLHELIPTADTWAGSTCPGGLTAHHEPAKLLMPVLITWALPCGFRDLVKLENTAKGIFCLLSWV